MPTSRFLLCCVLEVGHGGHAQRIHQPRSRGGRELQNLKGLLSRNGYTIRDGSIDSSKPNSATNPDYIKSNILAPRISWAGTMIVLISPNTHRSEWVNWEIEYAHRQGKPIVGVYTYGGKESDLPDAFKKYGEALVGWNSDNLMGAVRGEHDNWCEPAADGSFTIREPGWRVERHDC
jgi:hypothetical protein